MKKKSVSKKIYEERKKQGYDVSDFEIHARTGNWKKFIIYPAAVIGASWVAGLVIVLWRYEIPMSRLLEFPIVVSTSFFGLLSLGAIWAVFALSISLITAAKDAYKALKERDYISHPRNRLRLWVKVLLWVAAIWMVGAVTYWWLGQPVPSVSKIDSSLQLMLIGFGMTVIFSLAVQLIVVIIAIAIRFEEPLKKFFRFVFFR